MRNCLALAFCVVITLLPCRAIAQQKQHKNVTWMIQTVSDSTSLSIIIPNDTDTNIFLIPSVATQWDCMLGATQSDQNSKSRDLECLHKNQQGIYDSVIKNEIVCRTDGTKDIGTTFAKVGAWIPDPAMKKAPVITSSSFMDITVICSLETK